MPFIVPSFGEVLGDLLADFQNRFPKANVSRLSGHWKRLAVFAGGIMALHRHLQVIARDLMPDTATDEALDRWLAIYGLRRKEATAAHGYGALRVTGAEGSTLTFGQQLSASDGLIFQLDEGGVIPAEEFLDVDLRAISKGAATRKSKGTELTFLAPPAGIDSTAVLVADLDVDGVDREENGPARVRLLDQIAQPAMGGAANDFRAWAKASPDVSEAYVYPLRGGLGSVHLAALRAGQGEARLLSAPEIADLQTYIDGVRPVGYPGFLVLTVVAEPVDVELAIEGEDDPAYAFHWAGVSSVFSYNAGTRLLTLTGPRPAGMTVGKRLFWRSAAPPYHDGSEVEIEALSGSSAVVLKAPAAGQYDWTATPPVALDEVLPGGPLVTSVRAAIVAHINSLGPGRVSVPDDFSYGSSYWEGSLRRSKLHSLASKQKGAIDSEVIAPVANVHPTNEPPASTVGLLVPGVIIVREV